MVSPLGMDVAENTRGLREGRTAFSAVTLFDVSKQRVGTAGQVSLSDDGFPPRMDRGTRMAWLAAREAMAQAGLDGGAMPLVVGTSAAAMPLGEDYYRAALSGGEKRSKQLERVEFYQAQRQMREMAGLLGIDGRIRIVSNACASGANAIGQAFHLVRSGRADRVLAGGYDALCQLVFAGFDSLQALSPSGMPRPFDAHRDGLALGEGAGFVVVESMDSARSRGARVIAEITGYGAATARRRTCITSRSRIRRAMRRWSRCMPPARWRDSPRHRSITSTPTAPARLSTMWRKETRSAAGRAAMFPRSG